MTSTKLMAGKPFPAITLPLLGGGEADISRPSNGCDWQLIVVYRGKHCPLCTTYLRDLKAAQPKLATLGVDVIAVSADTKARATAHMSEVAPSFPVAYDLSQENALALGLYWSGVRNGKDVVRPFAEPGTFVLDSDGNLRIADVSNVPFARPNLEAMISGINFYRNIMPDAPTNGTQA